MQNCLNISGALWSCITKVEVTKANSECVKFGKWCQTKFRVTRGLGGEELLSILKFQAFFSLPFFFFSLPFLTLSFLLSPFPLFFSVDSSPANKLNTFSPSTFQLSPSCFSYLCLFVVCCLSVYFCLTLFFSGCYSQRNQAVLHTLQYT